MRGATFEGGDWSRWAQDVLADRAASPSPTIEWPGTFPTGSRILLLDESERASRSLKHATMRLVFRRLLAAGELRPGRTVVMASAGNAAVAAAHWCRRLALPCVVVIPASTAASKAMLIETEGARILRHAPPAAIYDEANLVATRLGGVHLDHFALAPAAAAERDWPLGPELFERVAANTGSEPTSVVAGLGSGATVAGLRAHSRSRGSSCRIVGVDAENSAYLRGWLYAVDGYGTGMPSRVEGIGRPVLPDSFDPDTVDLVVRAPDAASVAGARRLRLLVGKPVGASSGANLWAALRLARRATGAETIATFIADAHPHYLETCHDDAWCRNKGLDPLEFADYFDPAA